VAVRWAGDGAGTETLVVATHLNHVAAASEVRSRQLDMLGRWIDTIWPEGPAVVGGDLNLTPYSPEYTRIVTRWADLWPHARPADPGSTMVLDNPRFRDIDWMAERNGPGAPPGVRFDYLLARLDARGGPGLTVQTIDVIGGADHGWPSDHLGLVADIALIG
jgi:endonuclease/exonuclease/phosphatase family metal-dependent hydrolase